MKKGKVYLIGVPDEDRYKIGWTRRAINKRVDEVQTGNPKKVEVINLFETDHYLNVETWMHKVYASKRMEGEWFELTNEEVNDFTKNCQKGHDIFQMLIDSDNPFI